LLFSVESGLLVMYAFFTVLCVPLLLCILFGAQLISGISYLTRMRIALLLCMWILAVGITFFITILQVQKLIERVVPFSPNPPIFQIEKNIPFSIQEAFRATLKDTVIKKEGIPTGGFLPEMFLRTFPGLSSTDFEGVEASIGTYTIISGALVHVLDDARPIHTTATAITDNGLDTLLGNISVRLGIDLRDSGTLTQIMDVLTQETVTPPQVLPAPVAPTLPKEVTPPAKMCTQEAKVCPDGSAVGRTGPHCEFAPCTQVSQAGNKAAHQCTDAERGLACTREYRPVCGLVAVQCVSAPCPPLPQTFGNDCSACSEPSVLSYTEGACTL
jgi:hypothetical protein